MISLEAARSVVGQELEPGVIDRFVRHDPEPLARLTYARDELLEATPSSSLIPPLNRGEIRPLLDSSPYALPRDVESVLNSLWATLLYSHTAAIVDPLSSLPKPSLDIGRNRDPNEWIERERQYALYLLHFLAAVAPLVQSGILVLLPLDRLPQVKLDFGLLLASMQGLRAALIENAMYEGEFHPEWPAQSYISQLELIARTGWSVHTPPLSAHSHAERFALRALLRRGRWRLWRQRLKSVSLGRFDAFAIDTLTRVPVTDLSDLSTRDIQLIRDEDAFGAWRAELSDVIAEYERNVNAAVPTAARIATERLQRRAADIGGTIGDSPALSAARAGLGTFAIAGSAALAAFPVLSTSGRLDGLSMAVGSSLVSAGRRLVFHQRQRGQAPLSAATHRHYKSAGAIFRSKTRRRAAQRSR